MEVKLRSKMSYVLTSHYLQLKLLSGKNVRAWVSMDFTQDKFSAPIAIEKIKILGAPWELLAKQHCQSSQFTLSQSHPSLHHHLSIAISPSPSLCHHLAITVSLYHHLAFSLSPSQSRLHHLADTTA